MNRKARIWLTTALGFTTYMALVWFLQQKVGLAGWHRWAMIGGLGMVGAIGFVFSAVFLGKRVPPPPPPKDPLSVQLDEILRQAHRKLIDAKVAKGNVLQKLPAVFVFGQRQHHKTSAVIRSGVHAELLAGDVLRGVQVVPTQTANVWYAGGALIAEAGADVVLSPERWNRLLHRFQPARFSVALAQGEQAPRAALLCFSCEALRRPNARDAVIGAARELRATLGDMARAYGIRLPVYVLFTKADDIPGFKEYARRFSADEARDVLGATLPLEMGARAADYADRASARIREEFRLLFEGLAFRRTEILAREDAAQPKPAMYQFPRELRKLEPLIVEFLVELGRPSELQTSAFVRGFYFSGVREVVADEVAALAAPARPADDAAGATSLLRSVPQPAAASSQRAKSGTRREAQWVFLDRLFSVVVLGDAAALGVTRGGTRISFFRRAALAAGVAAAALVGIAVINSFFSNRTLQRDTRLALAAAATLPSSPAPAPSLEQLVRLDSLGAVVDVLYGQVRGSLISFGWGLSQSERLYDVARRVYLQRFERLMLDSTRDAMVASLATLPDSALSAQQYSRSFARLKAYLITTSHPDSSMDSLASVLAGDWVPAARFDSAGRQLALGQFARYARELPWRYPFPAAPRGESVQRAQAALRRSGADDRIYQAILESAARAAPPVQLPGTALQTITIESAFTRWGRDSVRYALDKDIDRYLRSDGWVLGDTATRGEGERDRLRRLFRQRYDSAYVGHWRAVFQRASVSPFARPSDAKQKLRELASNNSPLLYLLAAANEHLQYDAARTGQRFTPVKQIGAAKTDTSRVTDALRPYLLALNALAGKLEALEAPNAMITADHVNQAIDAQNGVIAAVDGIGLGPPDQVSDLSLDRILKQPAERATPVISRARGNITIAGPGGPEPPPVSEPKPLNDAGRLFCDNFRDLAGKRPFAPQGPPANVAEFDRVFALGSGLVWALGKDLGAVVNTVGSNFTEKAHASLAINPDALQFLRSLATIGAAMYPSGATIELPWQIAPADLSRGALKPTRVRMKFGSGPDRLYGDERSVNTWNPVTWRPAQDQAIEFTDVRGPGIPGGFAKTWSGPWAPLEFFGAAANWKPAGVDTYTFTVDLGNRVSLPMKAIMTESVRGVVQGNIFRGLQCPETWVRRK